MTTTLKLVGKKYQEINDQLNYFKALKYIFGAQD